MQRLVGIAFSQSRFLTKELHDRAFHIGEIDVFVPEGRTRIAQRFIAGIMTALISQVPEGRLKLAHGISVVPPGLELNAGGSPSHEWLGYSRMSLRDTRIRR